MDRLRLGLVGCGGMGTRHLYGLRELARTPFDTVDLCAVCDLQRVHAEQAAAEAERLLGTRPTVFTDLDEMVRGTPDLHAVDVVTDPSVHHGVVCQALDLGLHVLVEKPMAITVRACRQMVEAAARNRRILSVAENYRRDPSARLVRHLLERGTIGTPYMALFHHLMPGNEIFITPWRHLKTRGGPVLDMGVHFADLVRYQLGDIREVSGDVRLVEPVRKKPDRISSPYAFYRNRFEAMAPEVPADAEDTSTALFRMESGAVVNWAMGVGGHGRCGQELILGTQGCIVGFGTRGGRVRLDRAGGETLDPKGMRAAAGTFEPDPLSAHFFPSGISSDDPAVDWKLLAWELHELAGAVLHGKAVEVDGKEGLKDVAAVYAIFESSRAGRSVTMQEVETCRTYAYQAEIDAALGMV